ncbi:MAG: TMEM43 family protein [Bacteroidales bacterium]|nr:TMEM43 family protein [Bacteroidales bacterium]
MPVTQTTRTSYGQRLKNSGSGIVTGIIMFVIGTILLFWNEGRTIKTTRMIKAADKECVELPEVGTLDPSFDGKMVHLTGFAATDESFADSTFGVYASDILRMERKVEYYQMVERSETETKENLDGSKTETTTYYYDEKWVDEPVDSKSFYDTDRRDANWTLIVSSDAEFVAKEAKVGAYSLPEHMVSALGNKSRLELHPDMERLALVDEYAHRNYYTRKELVQVSNNSIYVGLNPAQPAIGDVRITYYTVPEENVSIMAKIQGNTFTQFTHKNGYSMELIRDGVVSKDEMVEQEKSANKALAWVLRLLGFFLIYLGLKGIFGFLETLFKIIPIVKYVVSFGIKLACFLLALAWTLIVIAVGWVYYRPVVGILMLVAAAALIWYVWKKGKEKKEAEAAAAPAAPVAPEQPQAPVDKAE